MRINVVIVKLPFTLITDNVRNNFRRKRLSRNHLAPVILPKHFNYQVISLIGFRKEP